MPEFETPSLSSLRIAIVCPFFDLTGNAGLPRIQRFVRWLEAAGARVTVISASDRDSIISHSWGVQLQVRDRLGLYPSNDSGAESPVARRENRFRRWLAYQLLNPDPSVVWSRSLISNQMLLSELGDLDVVISSNPPESAHIGALQLARKFSARFVMDMRDGWLDEPLRLMLQNSKLRRLRESVLERRCIDRASSVIVTSERWRALLIERYPNVAEKVQVITNAYPPLELYGESCDTDPQAGCVLVHAGRFQGSDPRRNPEDLLIPLLQALGEFGDSRGTIDLPGAHSERDTQIFTRLAPEFAQQHWSLLPRPGVARSELISKLNAAQGLLLVARSSAQIPAKLFEYLPTGLPILALVPKHSECWRICEPMAQVSLVDIDHPQQSKDDLARFLNAATEQLTFEFPRQFEETQLLGRFLRAIE